MLHDGNWCLILSFRWLPESSWYQAVSCSSLGVFGELVWKENIWAGIKYKGSSDNKYGSINEIIQRIEQDKFFNVRKRNAITNRRWEKPLDAVHKVSNTPNPTIEIPEIHKTCRHNNNSFKSKHDGRINIEFG